VVQKKDHSEITAFQVHARTKNYPTIFIKKGQMVSLQHSSTGAKTPNIERPWPIRTNIDQASKHVVAANDVEQILLDKNRFVSPSIIDKLVPETPGFYCIRLIDGEKLPAPFNILLAERGHNIVYIGIAKISLKTRFLNQEFRAIGHGTSFEVSVLL
jgi:hypothetical protein